ncbi:transcriptional regulator [Methylobacterium sp. J-090]|uniref:transcriptional regulator n=1 Tax=Methylobacterium sp. J-090 TaxID=2836666 RepID=UPI001FB9C356|nr:transcriptional regulator [Methylobacterium sp. J-090]MCJ2081538.1 transcriptional regulator [Methylobacterium sp. J-090]
MPQPAVAAPITVVSREDVVSLLRDAVAQSGGQRAWAESVGVSPSDVSSVLSGRRAAGRAILAALGITTVLVARAS